MGWAYPPLVVLDEELPPPPALDEEPGGPYVTRVPGGALFEPNLRITLDEPLEAEIRFDLRTTVRGFLLVVFPFFVATMSLYPTLYYNLYQN
jgi:hypothetical protein